MKVIVPRNVTESVYQKTRRSRSHLRSQEGRKGAKRRPIILQDGGGGDLGSEGEDSHLVKFEKCLTTNITNFSHYSQFDGDSLSSPTNPKV